VQSSGIIYIHIISCLVMALEQKIRFVLDLSLAESYIYGTATIITSNISYSINIQQATQQLIVLPTDVFYNEPADRTLISFGRLSEKSKNSNNNISIISEIKLGQGDLIEVYLNEDDIILDLANNLPMEMILQTNPL
jgi:hypothetical protein